MPSRASQSTLREWLREGPFALAMSSGFFGFFGVANVSMDFAKILFFIFLVLFVVSLLFGWRGRGVSNI